jgi:hypothetical protein
LKDLIFRSLEKHSSNLLSFGEGKFRVLPSKNKVADEKKLFQSGKFEAFIVDLKLSLWIFKFYNQVF